MGEWEWSLADDDDGLALVVHDGAARARGVGALLCRGARDGAALFQVLARRRGGGRRAGAQRGRRGLGAARSGRVVHLLLAAEPRPRRALVDQLIKMYCSRK